MNEPFDFTDAIVQTSRDIKRLGWTTERGRQYLMETYGKRSRQLLTDEELREFLAYLRSQPAPEEAGKNLSSERALFPPNLSSSSPIESLEFESNEFALSAKDFTNLLQETQKEIKPFESNEFSLSLEDSETLLQETTREIQRLGWTTERGRKYLMETYGKRSRQLLTDEELSEFLAYLQAQPTPSNAEDNTSQNIDSELQRLGWTVEREGDYLMQTYGTRSRQALTAEELDRFCAELKILQ